MSPSICFSFRLLSHENLWGFGFPSQLGTGHFFWNLVFPQDGKTICYSAVCIMRLPRKSELFSPWINKHLSGQMFLPSPSVGLVLAFPPLPVPASQYVWGLSGHGWDGETWLLCATAGSPVLWWSCISPGEFRLSCSKDFLWQHCSLFIPAYTAHASFHGLHYYPESCK